MTMQTIELPAVARFQSPVARLFQRLARWQEGRHQRAAMRVSLAGVPEHLRHDIGLDGGARLHPARQNGRSFDHNQHPDVALSQWGW